MKIEQMYICPKAEECNSKGNCQHRQKHYYDITCKNAFYSCNKPACIPITEKGKCQKKDCLHYGEVCCARESECDGVEYYEPITEKECGDCKGKGEFVDIDSRSYTICPTCNGSDKSPKTDSVDELRKEKDLERILLWFRHNYSCCIDAYNNGEIDEQEFESKVLKDLIHAKQKILDWRDKK